MQIHPSFIKYAYIISKKAKFYNENDCRSYLSFANLSFFMYFHHNIMENYVSALQEIAFLSQLFYNSTGEKYLG